MDPTALKKQSFLFWIETGDAEEDQGERVVVKLDLQKQKIKRMEKDLEIINEKKV